MNMKKLLSLTLALIMVLALFAGCDPANSSDPADIYQPIDLADAIEHQSFDSVYEAIGANITIDMVEEDADSGLAYVEYEGTRYELGMDFLSWAMVYNCSVPEGSAEYATEEDVYNEWFKLYIQRWNYLVPEVPLYSNRIFNLYNAKLQNFEMAPYWSAADGIIAASVKDGEENSIILGGTTELSGMFRNASWGKSSPGASDLDIQNLISGYSTMQTDKEGVYQWNMDALAEEPASVINEDGTLTYTIKIKEGMIFSDGSAITAHNYIAGVLANSTDVAVAAGGTGASGQLLVGYDAFKAYTGEGEKVYFEGIKLINDYEFSVTYQADYANYYYVNTYARFSPDPLALYLGDNEIVVDENGSCGLSDGFYAKADKDGVSSFVMADVISSNLKWNSDLPFSGPYVITNFDESALIATLTLNPNYPGDLRGKASIETITYVKTVTETVIDQFTAGEVDVACDLMDASEIASAQAVLEANPGKYACIDYDRAAYGKLGFRADLGPASMVEVRQAIMYTINRLEFAQTFTGGYGSVVHAAYYAGLPAFQANKDEIILNQYAYSVDSAIEVLEEGGWTYNSKGQPYVKGTDDVRYKKLSGYELSKQNLQFASIDGKYKTVKINGEYYMPLVFNWYGTQPNPVTDLLLTAWQTNPNATSEIGMYITYTSCDFTTGLYGEYLQLEDFGWDGVAKLTGINFATSFNSTLYDFSWNWTIDPSLYSDYSAYYLMDEADFLENYQ